MDVPFEGIFQRQNSLELGIEIDMTWSLNARVRGFGDRAEKMILAVDVPLMKSLWGNSRWQE